MSVKTIYFGPADTQLETWAGTQGNFSQYVRRLIQADITMSLIRDTSPGMVRLVESLIAVKANC